jgi:hypothetical protein
MMTNRKTKQERIIEAMEFFRRISVDYDDEADYFELALEALDWKRMIHGSYHDVDEFYRD